MSKILRRPLRLCLAFILDLGHYRVLGPDIHPLEYGKTTDTGFAINIGKLVTLIGCFFSDFIPTELTKRFKHFSTSSSSLSSIFIHLIVVDRAVFSSGNIDYGYLSTFQHNYVSSLSEGTSASGSSSHSNITLSASFFYTLYQPAYIIYSFLERGQSRGH